LTGDQGALWCADWSQRTVGVVARMVAVASIKTREASAGRLSHKRRATANEKSVSAFET